MEKNIQASETAGGASLAVDLPECSFLLYHAECFCQSLCVEFSRLIFVDLETARSAMVRIRRRIRRHEMAECSF